MPEIPTDYPDAVLEAAIEPAIHIGILRFDDAIRKLQSFPEEGGESSIHIADWRYFADHLYCSYYDPVESFVWGKRSKSHYVRRLNKGSKVTLKENYTPGKFRGVILRRSDKVVIIHYGMLGHDENGYYLLKNSKPFYLQQGDALYAQNTEFDPNGPWTAPPANNDEGFKSEGNYSGRWKMAS